MKHTLKDFLPEFPKTLHLPWEPNPGHGDTIARLQDVEILNDPSFDLYVEEKVDGASVGIMLDEELHPVVRNKDHILNKGYLRKKNDTTAKIQFRPLWNWVYQHVDELHHLKGHSVYGQWMLAQHGMEYDSLPDWFIAHDLFDHEERKWVDPWKARFLLEACGFYTPWLKWARNPDNRRPTVEEYLAMAREPSALTNTEPAEGIYLKVSNGKWIVNRFKMVRQDFVQGRLWDDKVLKRNRLKEKKHGVHDATQGSTAG